MRITEIVKALEEIAILLELLNENRFKISAHKNAASILDRQFNSIEDYLSAGKVKGIGENTSKLIQELIETGESSYAKELRSNFDESFLEILKIKGLGVKKLISLRDQLGISSIEELEEACKKDKLTSLKGFAKKTQEKILKNIEFYKTTRGFFYYSKGVEALLELDINQDYEIVGKFRENEPLINALEIEVSEEEKSSFLKSLKLSNAENQINIKLNNDLPLKVHFVSDAKLEESRSYYEENFSFENTINEDDIKGIIHAHSTYSDGLNSLKDMAIAVRDKGYKYFGISDHSQTAFYAGGLKEDTIKKQHEEIDKLNEELSPFVIYKGIESDILKDGSLDYSEKILESFDFIIASVHSNFEMKEDEMTARIIRAIENPHTTILGHPTGRLLLRRPGYEVNMDQIIEAAAKNNVIIEINSNPARLDLDYTLHKKAIDSGVKLAICPDAHSIDQIDYVKYGVAVAKKGGVKKEDVVNCKDADYFTKKISAQRI